MELKTDYQIEKEARENQIYREYQSLIANGAAIVKANEILMKKYNIHSASTLWAIRKRVSQRLAMERKNKKNS